MNDKMTIQDILKNEGLDSSNYDYLDPGITLSILDQLDVIAIPKEIISRLHCSNKDIDDYRAFCDAKFEDGHAFRTRSDQLFQLRIYLLLTLLRAGDFSCRRPEMLSRLVAAINMEIPFVDDNEWRPLGVPVRESINSSLKV